MHFYKIDCELVKYILHYNLLKVLSWLGSGFWQAVVYTKKIKMQPFIIFQQTLIYNCLNNYRIVWPNADYYNYITKISVVTVVLYFVQCLNSDNLG